MYTLAKCFCMLTSSNPSYLPTLYSGRLKVDYGSEKIFWMATNRSPKGGEGASNCVAKPHSRHNHTWKVAAQLGFDHSTVALVLRPWFYTKYLSKHYCSELTYKVIFCYVWLGKINT